MLAFWLLFVAISVYSAERVNTCGPDQYPCNDGSCVAKIKWCDAKLDCEDDSDENYCLLRSVFRQNPNNCNQTIFFLCEDGPCIPLVGRCDGFSSCMDNSDEKNCDVSEMDTDVKNGKNQMQNATEESAALNGNESKAFTSLHVNEHLMQSNDSKSHSTATPDLTGTVGLSFSESNISEYSFRVTSKQTNHHILTTSLPISDNLISKNLTNHRDLDTKSGVLRNHKQALEFRDLLGGMLNSSNERNISASDVNSTTSNSASFNESSGLKHYKNSKDENSSEDFNHLGHLGKACGDSQSSENTVKEEDLRKGYIELDLREFRNTKDKASQWLISKRGKDHGWGEETARALTALYMAADHSIGKLNEKALMSKELHLKLFTSLSRNETKKVSLGDLALYINALSASCDNPKNFHGHDLVKVLRHRTNFAQESSEFVTPFVYLVLCLNNESSREDVLKVQEMLYNSTMSKLDSEAVMSLAATCLSRIPTFSTTGIEQIAARILYRRIMAKGLPANIYELALLTQALNEARVHQDLWNRTEAMARITNAQLNDGSFGDILSTYYALPTLCGKSLLWIGKNCHHKDAGLTPIEVLKNGKNPKMYINYSLHFGNPVEMSQSLVLKVQTNTSFLDIMRIAATTNPIYEFKYESSEGKTTVYSIGGIANDAERGLYWIPYTSLNSKELEPLEGDIRSYIPAVGEYVAFWRKTLI